jgi:hypothetical protein
MIAAPIVCALLFIVSPLRALGVVWGRLTSALHLQPTLPPPKVKRPARENPKSPRWRGRRGKRHHPTRSAPVANPVPILVFHVVRIVGIGAVGGVGGVGGVVRVVAVGLPGSVIVDIRYLAFIGGIRYLAFIGGIRYLGFIGRIRYLDFFETLI